MNRKVLQMRQKLKKRTFVGMLLFVSLFSILQGKSQGTLGTFDLSGMPTSATYYTQLAPIPAGDANDKYPTRITFTKNPTYSSYLDTTTSTDGLFRYGYMIPGGGTNNSYVLGTNYYNTKSSNTGTYPINAASLGTLAQALASVVTNGQYVGFTVRPATNYKLNLTTIRIGNNDNGSAHGSSAITANASSWWTLRSSLDTFKTNVATWGSNADFRIDTISLPAQFQNLAKNQEVTFRLYLYGNSGNGTAIRIQAGTDGAGNKVKGIEIDGSSVIAIPVPSITSLNPSTLYAGASAQNLTIKGTNFVSGTSVVSFNGTTTRATTFVDANTLTIPLSSGDLATDGVDTIVVTNTGNATTSNSATFTILKMPSIAVADNGTQPGGAGQYIQVGSSNNIIQSFTLNATKNNDVVTAVTAHLTGNYKTTNFNSFKIYTGTSSNFNSATQLGAPYTTIAGGPEDVTFSGFTDTVKVGVTKYYWIVANVSATVPTSTTTIVANGINKADIALQNGVISNTSDPIVSGTSGALTILNGTIATMDDISNQPSGNITQYKKNVVLAGFTISPSQSCSFTQVKVTASGTATSTDLSNIHIINDANFTGAYDPAYDIVSDSSALVTGGTSMVFKLNQTVATRTQYLIVADVADVLVSTPGNTVQLNIYNGDFTTSLTESGSMNGAQQLTIAPPVGTSTLATVSSAATISSLATKSSGSTVAAYTFSVKDDGNTPNVDGAPTKISKLVIKAGTGNTVSDWSAVLSGASLTSGTDTLVGTVNTSNITFTGIDTTNGKLGYVADNATKTYTLNVWLKASSLTATLHQTLNGLGFVFKVQDSSFTNTGSAITPGANINSGASNNIISVVATKLIFVQAPTSGNPSVTLSPAITVQAVDSNGNYATTYTSQISLSATPSGTISGNGAVTPVNGLATFSALQFSSNNTYVITATSGSLSTATANVIIASALYFNFSSSGNNWDGSNKWGTSSSSTTGKNWIDGYDPYFVGTGGSVSIPTNHNAPSLNFSATGYSLTGSGILTLLGSNPAVNITGAVTLNSPISSSGNVLFNPPTSTSGVTINFGSTSSNYAGGATFGAGITGVNVNTSNSIGTSASQTLTFNATKTAPLGIGTASATFATTTPIIVPNNIVFGTGAQVSVGPTGNTYYGNIIKYNGVISGTPNQICFSNSTGFTSSGVSTNGGKGFVYFGAKNTYNGTTYLDGNNSSLILGGGDNTLPSNTDVLFWTGGSGNPILDLNGSNEKIASITTTDGNDATTHVTTNTYPGGVYNSFLQLPVYNASLDRVYVKKSDATSVTVGTKVYGPGITDGTTVTSIYDSTATSLGNTVCSVMKLSQSITNFLSTNQGAYVFFGNTTQKTLTIEGTNTTGFAYGWTAGHNIDHTNANFGGIIAGNIALTLSSANNSANRLTLLNKNTYYGTTTVTSGTLQFDYAGGNTIPATNDVVVNGGTLRISRNQTVNNLTLSSGTLLIDSAATLTINGTFTYSGGTISNANGTISYGGASTLVYAQSGSVTLDATKEFKNAPATLQVNAGTKVLLTADQSFAGTLVNNGTIASTGTSFLTGNALILNGTAQTISGNGSFAFLTINKTGGNISVGGSTVLNVINKLSVKAGTFAPNARIELKSTSLDSTAVVDSVLGSFASGAAGKVIVERFIPKGLRAYRQLGAEVANAGSVFANWQEGGVNTNGYGTQITGTNIFSTNAGVDATTGFDYLKYYAGFTTGGSFYTDSNNVWSVGAAPNYYSTIASTKNLYLNPFAGYELLIRGNRTLNLFQVPQPSTMTSNVILRATGNLITGTVSYSTSGISSSVYSSTYHLSTGANSFSFIANPYVAPINWISVYNRTKATSNITSSYWYLDPTFEFGSIYVTYNAVSQTNNNPDSSNMNQYIQPGQAFFVQNKSTSSAPSFTIQESDKVAASTKTAVFGVVAKPNRIAVALYKNNRNVDGAVAVFSNDFTSTIGDEDSRKITNSNENIAIVEGGNELSIDGLANPVANDVVALKLSQMVANTNYELHINTNDFVSNGVSAYLNDKFSNTQTLLTAGVNTIAFTATSNAATYNNRFDIIFKTASPLAANKLVVKAAQKGENINVEWNVTNENNVASYQVEKSINGKEFNVVNEAKATNNNTVASYNWLDTKVVTGNNYYRIKSISFNGQVVYSNIVLVTIGTSNKEQIAVYPNPVQGKSFGLQMTNMNKGTYNVTVFNSIGQVVMTKSIAFNGGSATQVFELGSTLTAGIYTISVKGENGTSLQTELIAK